MNYRMSLADTSRNCLMTLTMLSIGSPCHAQGMALAGYFQHGTPDTTFGTGGRVVTPIPGFTGAYGVAADSLNRVVVGGMAGAQLVLARYDQSGSLDLTFGAAHNGLSMASVPLNARATALALDSANRIVVAGTGFGLRRFKADGTPDGSFGSCGFRVAGPPYDEYAVAIAPDGKIVTAGTSHLGYIEAYTVVRYTSDGCRDSSFGALGMARTDVWKGFMDITVESGADLAIDKSGNIVVTGRLAWYKIPEQGDQAQQGAGFAVLRYTPSGQLDSTFGGNLYDPYFGPNPNLMAPEGPGYTLVKVSGDEQYTAESANAVALDGSGRIVVAGGYSTPPGNPAARFLTVTRLDAKGNLDFLFGTLGNGVALTDLGPGIHSQAKDLLITPEGTILAAGGSGTDAAGNFGLASFDFSGGLNNGFGNGRILKTSFGCSGNSFVAGLALQTGGYGFYPYQRIVAAGSADNAGGLSGTIALTVYYGIAGVQCG